MAWGQTATAQSSSGSFALDRYRPAPTGDDGFALNTAADSGSRKWGASAQFAYARDPLVLESPPGDANAEKYSVVANHTVAHVNAYVGFDNRWVLFAGIPLHLGMSGTHVTGVPDSDGTGFGDPTVGFRLRFLGDDNPDRGRLALQVAAEFPLARAAEPAQAYSGGPQPTLVPQLIGDVKAGVVRLIASVGGRLVKGESVLLRQRLDHQLTAGVGAIGYLGDKWTLHGEIFGSTYTADAFARVLTPVELLLGGKFAPSAPVRLGLAGTAGLSRGIGSPDFRVIANIGYVHQPAASPPAAVVAAVPRAPADADADADAIADTVDNCPTEAEDVDGVDDTDGCPDRDQDADGVSDSRDKCPQEAEDLDKFSDEDGCPERDNDGDAILDADDKCPTEVGVAEQQGCPLPDSDGDGLVDPKDDCPKESGVAEYGGCSSKPLVEISGKKVELRDTVLFEPNGDKILPESHRLLEDVARALIKHPELGVIRVEGHTDSLGAASHNLKLSEARATSVAVFLAGQGVPKERLQAAGYGSTRPLTSNATEAGRAKNRRVVFVPVDAGK